MSARLRQTAAPTTTTSGADFSLHFSEAVEWLEKLLQLVDNEAAGYSALKFSNYLEAEMQLFRRMPQLRAVCKEARRLCRSDPSTSPHIASRMGQLQAIWLAVESRLAQFKTKKALLTALSVDLKQLETNECDNQADSDLCAPGAKHMCCTRKIELLDGAIQKKEGQMQQMLSVTAAISRLLDWVCANDFLSATDRSRSTTTATVSTNSPAAVVSPAQREDSIAATAAAAAAAEAAIVARDQQSMSTTGSTTYLRTVTNTDGDQADLVSSESSEIIVQTGHNSTQLGAATSSSNSHYRRRRPPLQSNWSSRQSDPSTSVTGSERILEVGIESAHAAAAAQRDNHNALACCASTDTKSTNLCLSDARDSTEDASAADTDCDDFSLPRDKIATATSDLSPLLQAVDNRVAALKASVELVQARLLHSGAAEDSEAQASQLDLVGIGLKDWQCELSGLRAGVLKMSATSGEEAIFKRAYLESIALLSNWTDSLQDRCRLRLLELRRTH